MKNFFLEGDKFVGKSLLIQQLLKEMKIPVSGFYVQRIMDQQKKTVTFELRAASELSLIKNKISTKKEHCFIANKEGEQKRNLSVFTGFGCTLLQEASASEKMILLDEIGGIELLSDSFSENLYAIFKQPKKIIGVFKSEKNYQNQRINSLEKIKISQQRQRLKDAIVASDGDIITMNQFNHQEIADKIRHFLSH